jgi:crossover junction endodeoxyribonuclease RusA
VRIEVCGVPAPQGSKKGFAVKKNKQYTGKVAMVESSKKVKPWRQDVKSAALDARGVTPVMTGDVRVYVTFWFARPRSHYRTGRNSHLLRALAPVRPCGRPDLDKLVRSTCDGLGEAQVFGDDAQISDIQASKRYATPQQIPGASITVECVPNVMAVPELVAS